MKPQPLPALLQKITKAWCKESSCDPDNWSMGNRAWGQSVASALLVQERLGGDIMRIGFAMPDGNRGSHCLNLLADGSIINAAPMIYPFDTQFYPHIEGLDLAQNTPSISAALLRPHVDEAALSDLLNVTNGFRVKVNQQRCDILREKVSSQAFGIRN